MQSRRESQRAPRPPRSLLVVALSLVVSIGVVVLEPALASSQAVGTAAGLDPAGRDAPQIPGYTLTWKDDFNGAAGKPLEPGKWIYDTGTGYGCVGCPSQWGTAEIESMSDSTQNVSFDGQGNLLITPVRNADGTWSSGRIETRKTTFTAGDHGILRVQASIQLPQTGVGPEAAGYWPAFWMLGNAFRGNYLNWPGIGEIDIMESINGRPTLFSTLHCGIAPGGPCNEFNGIGKSIDDATLQDTFHTYAVELDTRVEPNQLRFYLDDLNYGTIFADQVPPDTWANATGHGFFIILDVAVGGSFPWAECNFFPHTGGCTGPTPFPEVVTADTVSGRPMKVAYVAVYSKE
jgi:beta-glucanase (GH16 family)